MLVLSRMATCVLADSQWTELNAAVEPRSENRQLDRIAAALGLSGGPLPEVDDETLSRYYEYLSANLTFP